MASLADSLDAARAEQQTREEWRGTGNTGRMPPGPLEPPPAKTARRLDRETWRTIAEMRAREVFLLSGEFDELRAAYAMSDADLWQTLTKREAGDDTLERRIRRLDHGKSLQARALEKLTDDELEAQIKSRLAAIDPL